MWLRAIFRRELPPVEQLIAALLLSADRAENDAAALEYRNSADALRRAVSHGGTPTDHLSYVFSRAQLNLDEQIAQLLNIAQDTHTLVQGVQLEQREQGAAVNGLRADFQGRMTSAERRLDRHDAKLAEHDESRDASIQERAQHTADLTESKAHRARIQAILDAELPAIHSQLSELNTQVEKLSAQIAQAFERQAGDGSV